jgi:hypothetical protein
MKRCFFSFIAISILLFSEVLAQSVTRAWVARYNAANSLDEASSLAIDNAGYIYVTGNSAGLGNANDYLTIKYNPDGTAAWITRVNFGVNSNDFGQDIVIDNASNVYVTGQGGATYATVKYNSTTGDTIWTKRYRSGPNTFDVAKKLAPIPQPEILARSNTTAMGIPCGLKYLMERTPLIFRKICLWMTPVMFMSPVEATPWAQVMPLP